MHTHMKKFASTTISLLLTVTVFAWGPTGHRVVGEVGQKYLNKKANKQVAAILGTHSLAEISTWPDEIKSNRNWNFVRSWHYVSVNDDQQLAEVLKNDHVDGEVQNVVEGIQFFAKILEGDAATTDRFEAMMKENEVEPLYGSTQATALAFLVHFIGDIHQPLHVGRKEDRGGNNIDVLWFGKQKRLHSVWDGELVEYDKLSFTEYVDFINHTNEGQVADWQSGDVLVWAQESIDVRQGLYDSTYEDMVDKKGGEEGEKIANLRYNYASVNTPLVKERLLQAGIRLAGMLNAIYG